MIRVGFTRIGGPEWWGGYNYLLNLLRSVCLHARDRIEPVLFLGADVDATLREPFEALRGLEVITSAAFDRAARPSGQRQALVGGLDGPAVRSFTEGRIDALFEWARFFGWRLPFPAIAWLPDFQHRKMRHLFGARAFWQRDLGFRAQVAAGRKVMLSSEDARRDCEQFYPASRGRTHVVRFAVPAAHVDATEARATADAHALPASFYFMPNQLWIHKNHECVIRALHETRQRGRPMVVAASGQQHDPRNPGHLPRLRALMQELGVAEDLRLLGNVPYRHVSALMRASDGLINPSLFEGWSTPVEEAKSMGTPLLLSGIAVHREQGGARARYFDPAAPMQLAQLLLEDRPPLPAEREHSVEQAATAAGIRVEAFALEFAALLEQAVAGSASKVAA